LTERVIIGFCGFGTKFVELIRKRLLAQRAGRSVRIGVVSRQATHEEHVTSLVQRLLSLLEQDSADDQNLRLLVVSTRTNIQDDQFERACFIPAVRRMIVDPQTQSAPQKAFALVDEIHAALDRWSRDDTRSVARPRHDAIALLPLRNANVPALNEWLDQKAHFGNGPLPNKLLKRISRQSNGDGVLIGNIKFKGVLNGPGHPIRRRTDTAVCDLKARSRLGHLVPANFEFDVSCKNGLGARRFWLCDGQVAIVPASATHLNMRVNDDFKYGT
jgi:hypothetical protein